MSLVKFITYDMPKSSLFLLFMPIFHRIFFTGTSLVHRFRNNYTTHLSANPIAQV